MSHEQLIQGIAASELAAAYGTPLYVYDGDVIAAQYDGIRRRLDSRVEIFYSLKANPAIAVCALLHRLGAGAEVSSLAELASAERAGVPAARTIFLGPGKSADELAACLTSGVKVIVAESVGELDILDAMAAGRETVPTVAIRVNPAFSVKGSGLTMGGKPRQFGIDEDQLLALGDPRRRWPHLHVAGIHAYVGTRILNEAVIATNTERILALAEQASERLGLPLELVDIGGGLGVAYFDGERDLDPAVVTELVNPVVAAFAERHPGCQIAMELGRYLTALAGTYLVRVRYVKTSMGERFAVADGGTNHHMAAVGIGSYVKRNFPVSLASRIDEPTVEPWNVTGPLCTPNDTLIKAAMLPPVRPGDLIGVGRSGAYGPSASPVHFLSHGYPAEVLVTGGQPWLIRRRDTVADLLRHQDLGPAADHQPDLVPASHSVR